MAQIMIVEDSQGTNKAICEYMKSAGHTLIPAFDGAEALNIFRDRKIDLIVLDIMLPKISGLAVLHEIRKSSNNYISVCQTIPKARVFKRFCMTVTAITTLDHMTQKQNCMQRWRNTQANRLN